MIIILIRLRCTRQNHVFDFGWRYSLDQFLCLILLVFSRRAYKVILGFKSAIHKKDATMIVLGLTPRE